MSIKTTDMTVKEVMITKDKFPQVKPDDFLKLALGMMTDYNLGIVCVVSGVILWFGIKFLSGDNNPLFLNNKFFVEYKDINGLEKANDITISGGVIGQVTDLILTKSSNSWLVEVSIDEPKILEQLTKNSVFEIQDDGFLGTKIILLKIVSGEKAYPGDTLKGELNGLMSNFSSQFDGFDIQQVIVPVLEVLEKVAILASDLDRVIVNNEGKIDRVFALLRESLQMVSDLEWEIQRLVKLVEEIR